MASPRDYLGLTLGVAACAASVIFIKASHVHPVALAGWRLVIAAALLTPVLLHARRQLAQPRTWPNTFTRALPGAALLAVHLITWAAGARMTTAANATMIVNLVPVVMPFLMLLTVGERITRREIAGSLLSLAGLAVLSVGVVRLAGNTFLGDVVCFGSMVLVAAYLAIGRKLNDGTSLWLYVVPLYWIAGLMCLALCLIYPGYAHLLPTSEHQPVWREWLWLALLAIVPTIIGHTFLNLAMRKMRGQIVSVINLAQFVFAGILAYACYGESPNRRFYLASLLTVAGAVVIVTERKSTPAKPDQVLVEE